MKQLDSNSGRAVANAIDTRIINIAKQVYRTAPFDKIVRGRIVGKENKKYTIKIRASKYTAYAMKLGYEININDEVVCVVPNNNYSDIFIMGKLDT